MGRFTFTFAAIGLLLCVIHFFGHESGPVYLLFYALSVPAWFTPIMVDVTRITITNMMVIYALTVLTWGIIGLVIDRFVRAPYKRRSTY